MLSPPTFDTGTVTGIIGAITGSVGCITGLISYRRSQRIKALDLRLELRKLASDVRAEVEALPGPLGKCGCIPQRGACRYGQRAAIG